MKGYRSKLMPLLLAALLAVAVGILSVDSSAWTLRDFGGLDAQESGAATSGDVNAKRAVVERQIAFRNKSGSSILQGEPVAIDATSITVVTAATGADGMTIANGLATEGGAHTVMVSVSADAGSALTGTLAGTDQDGLSQSETITTAATGRAFKSSKFWKTITAVNMANLSAVNVGVYAYPVNGITDAASNSLVFVGLATDTIADNAEGAVATACGSVVLAKVKGPSVIPGDPLSCDGSQALDEDSTAPVAIALEPTVSKTGELVRVLMLRASD